METEFDEGFLLFFQSKNSQQRKVKVAYSIQKTAIRVYLYLLVFVERPEDFRSIQKVRIVQNPMVSMSVLLSLSPNMSGGGEDRHGKLENILLDVEQHKRQVQNQGHPITVDKEQRSEESVDTGFGDDVGVQAVAKVDRVNIVTF